jgi:oligopeptide transport system permease protein
MQVLHILVPILKKLGRLLLTLWIVITASFFLLAVAPGDALQEKVERMPEAARVQLYKNYGLDKPILERYFITMKGVVKGDFGQSITYPNQTVQKIISTKGPVSLRLAIQALVFGLSIGILLGIFAAIKKDTALDRFVLGSSVVLTAFPSLILAILLQRYLGGVLGWFPVIGWPKGKDLFFGGWQYTILPMITAGIGLIPSYARYTRNSMLDHINSEYVEFSKAKGTSYLRIVFSDVFRNSLIPLLTKTPVLLAAMTTGLVFTESVFSIPGIGAYFIGSIAGRDYTTVLGLNAYFAIIFIAAIFLTDVLYTLADPRIRFNKSKGGN